MSVNDIFELLAKTPSRNEKIAILKDNQDNADLKTAVFLALDPFTQFYIRKIPKYMTDAVATRDISVAMNDLSVLSSRSATGHDAIDWLTDILETLSSEDAKVIERIIQKDLKCGVSEATANAVWSGLIKTYPVMLCTAYDKKVVDKINYPAYAQMKMDGMRFNAIVKHTESGSSVEFRSRSGKEIDLLGNLVEEFISLSNGNDVVFDGELLVMFDGDYQFADRKTGNGILNKANKGTISEKEASIVHASLWDMIDYADFIKGKSSKPYFERFELLSSLVNAIPAKSKKIWLVSNNIVNDIVEATKIFEDYLNSGYEGIILKDIGAGWEDKRAKHQVKFKGENECDLKIVSIETGTGKYAGMLGAIVCESSDGKVRVSVGSGFTDLQRKQLFTEELIDKIVAVKYNERIKNKNGDESLFLPIFIELREDKVLADSSSNIK